MEEYFYFWLVVILICCLIFLCTVYNNYYYPLGDNFDDNYIHYDNTTYPLIQDAIYKFNENQYFRNNDMTFRVTNPNIMAVVIFKKHNYVCDGLVGAREIRFYDNTMNTDKIFLEKNTDCFPNGGLEPEYLVVIPKKNNNFNSYWLSVYYKPTDDPKKIYDYLVNFNENKLSHSEGY